jgi:hypothetical protein
MRNKKAILLSLLVSAVMLIEGWAFFSKPKIMLNKAALEIKEGASSRNKGDSLTLVKGDSFPILKSEAEQKQLSSSV